MTDETQIKSLLFPVIKGTEQYFAPCPACNAAVTIYASKQNCGEGHKCGCCQYFFVVVMCPYCKSLQAIEAKEWDEVRELGKYQCPDCNGEAKLEVKKFELQINEAIKTAALVSWSGTDSEQKLISEIQRLHPTEIIEQFAQIHYAVAARLRSAKSELEAIKRYGIKTLSIFNNAELNDINGEHKRNAETSAFIISNALISSIEILTQELVRLLRINWELRYIGFWNAVSNKKFNEKSPELQNVFDSFAHSDEYKFLSKLRRCIHHYQSIPLSIDSTFTVEMPGSIVEQALPATHIIYLPDDPSRLTSGFTFDQRRELVPTLSNITHKVEELVLDAYGRAVEVLQRY